MDAGRVVKVEGGKNDLLDRIAADSAFGVTREELEGIMKPETSSAALPSRPRNSWTTRFSRYLTNTPTYSDLMLK